MDYPMGISQWKAHGKKYLYWSYFTQECARAYEDEITAMIREYANTPLGERKDGSAILWELHERVQQKQLKL